MIQCANCILVEDFPAFFMLQTAFFFVMVLGNDANEAQWNAGL